jgi:hypothetical protein
MSESGCRASIMTLKMECERDEAYKGKEWLESQNTTSS